VIRRSPGGECGGRFWIAGNPRRERGNAFGVARGPGGQRGSGFLVGGDPRRELRSAFLVAGNVAWERGGVFLVVGRLLVVTTRLLRQERTIRGSVRGLDGDSRAVLMITSGPDIEGRAVLVIVRGWVRGCRVGLVVNAHISA